MAYTAKQQLDLIKANKLEIIDKINELLGEDSELTWDSPWSQFITKINEIKTTLPIENDQIITEIEHFIANQSINNIAIASDKIKENMFRQKSSLLTITAPNVEQIEQYAFYSATGLISIIASNCTNIGTRAFYECNKLENAIFNENCALGTYAFNGCTKLSTISRNLTANIPTYAFYNCYNLELNSDSFPAVKTVGSYAFYNCDKLTDFNFDGVTSISSYAFQNCGNLTEIDLTGCSANIESYAFNNCTNVNKVIVADTITGIQSRVFQNLKDTCKIYCEQTEKPNSWSSYWNYSNYPVYWNAKLRSYKFIVNNGESDIVKVLRAVEDSDLPVLTRDGYIFDNWYVNSDFSKKIITPYISATNLQLYARWIRGYNVILVNYQTLEQTDIGLHYYSSLNDIVTNFFINNITYTAVGAYYDANCTQLIEALDTTHVIEPLIYIKVVESATYTEVSEFEFINKSYTKQLVAGEHLLECWGASGGQISNMSNITACRGGYSKGLLTLSETTNAFIYVGGQGSAGIHCAGGFNGGGDGHSSYNRTVTSGGGATDIRLNTDSLYSRVIVAGGGGGGHDSSTTPTGVSCGGGDHGVGGYNNSCITYNSNTDRCGAPGTQTRGGLGRTTTSWGTAATVDGTFGQGGYYLAAQYSTGGGGGWYGGGAGGPDGAAGGGSGYVYTVASAENYPTGCLLNASYYLNNTQNLGGYDTFDAPTGASEMGHFGNGYARITSTISGVQNPAICTVYLYGITNENNLVLLDTLKLQHNIYNNTLPTFFSGWTIDNWYIDQQRTTLLVFPYEIILNGSLSLYTNIKENIVYNFEYSGLTEELSLDRGKYLLECWGAQGGTVSETYKGGKGGYSTGILTLDEQTTLYINVGQQGTVLGLSTSVPASFNGGGYSRSNSYYGGSGGGASDIRINTNSLYARVIVAGGGGGGHTQSGGGSTGGFGGGLTSGGSTATIATQTKPGSYSSSYASAPVFGQGGGGQSNGTAAGGGGGWYGGSAQSINDYSYTSGGGSGYVFTSASEQYYPTGCLLTSSYYLTNAETIGGDQQFKSPDREFEVGHSGNGYIRITKIRLN